jgi:hypothetical protein
MINLEHKKVSGKWVIALWSGELEEVEPIRFDGGERIERARFTNQEPLI